MLKFLSVIAFVLSIQTLYAQTIPLKEGDYTAHKAEHHIVINGKANDKDWAKANWHPIKNNWLGNIPTPEDFQGKYKILWNEDYLYFLVEIQDDSLSDQHQNPFEKWWEDDCLELFIDENNSDGNHQYNHSAFAYHITLDLDVVDMGTDQNPILLNDHITAKWVKTNKNTYVWEIAMRIYSDTYNEKSTTNPTVKLTEGRKMGFAVSYNDNDGHFKRENMMGSVPIQGDDKNRGWIDAGVFGTVELVQ